MATTAQIIALMRTAVAGTTGATTLSSDHLVEERIAPSAIRYQLVSVAVEVVSVDSSTPRAQVFARFSIHRRLGTSEAERAYTEVAMQSNIDAMILPAYWRALSVDIVEVTHAPQVQLGDIKRVGDVVSYILTVAVEYRT